MFCPNCGQQIPDGSIFCPVCGANLQYQAPDEVPVNLEGQNTTGFVSILRGFLTSSKFLAMCIIVTIATILACVPTMVTDATTGEVTTSSSFDIFGILSTCAMWITYAKAKSSDPVMSLNGLRFTAGITKAVYIINWISVGLLFLLGIIFVALVPFITTLFEDPAAIEDFISTLQVELGSLGLGSIGDSIDLDVANLASIVNIIVIVLAVVLFISAIVVLFLNIFYYGKVSKFAYNLHVSYITNKVTDLRFATISNWFMVLGVLGIIGSISSLLVAPVMGISAVLSGVNLILASQWVKTLGEAAAMIPQPAEVEYM